MITEVVRSDKTPERSKAWTIKVPKWPTSRSFKAWCSIGQVIVVINILHDWIWDVNFRVLRVELLHELFEWELGLVLLVGFLLVVVAGSLTFLGSLLGFVFLNFRLEGFFGFFAGSFEFGLTFVVLVLSSFARVLLFLLIVLPSDNILTSEFDGHLGPLEQLEKSLRICFKSLFVEFKVFLEETHLLI